MSSLILVMFHCSEQIITFTVQFKSNYETNIKTNKKKPTPNPEHPILNYQISFGRRREKKSKQIL